MSMGNLPLMRALNAKTDYLYKRQEVLAENIANADTPRYQSRDLTKVDFGSVLKDVVKSNAVRLESTNPMHVGAATEIKTAKDPKDKMTYEVAPDGNGVIVEEQMVKANQTMMDYNLMVNLSRKQSNLMKIALGRQG